VIDSLIYFVEKRDISQFSVHTRIMCGNEVLKELQKITT
jgi:hypothetical protein